MTFIQCCFNAGPPSSTLAQHLSSIGWMPRVFWGCIAFVKCIHVNTALIYLGLPIWPDKARCHLYWIDKTQKGVQIFIWCGITSESIQLYLFGCVNTSDHLWVPCGVHILEIQRFPQNRSHVKSACHLRWSDFGDRTNFSEWRARPGGEIRRRARPEARCEWTWAAAAM